MSSRVIRRRALRVVQDPKHPVLLFALTADELIHVAEISRVGRDGGGDLIGYQRPEVRKHVQNIQAYLDSGKGKTLFPSTLILALSSSVRFVQVRGPKIDDGLAEAGTVEIPVPSNGQRKPAWIVDGQQRALALTRCTRRDLPVLISAFIADDVATQREQYLRNNSTKPLPRGLVTELLPEVDTILPPHLAARKVPSALCETLNRDPESPFHNLIRRASAGPFKRGAVITDPVVIQMLQDSFGIPSGCLFSYRNLATGETDYESIRALLHMYWSAAFRRAELVSLDVGDVVRGDEGLVVTLRRSKCDQEGRGATKGIPFASLPAVCPVRALARWLEASGIAEGPLFRGIDRHGHLQGERLHPSSVARIVKRCAERAGLDPEKFAGHSLRAGFATTAAKRGKSLDAIMRQTLHRSERVARSYIRHAKLFDDNAAGGLF